MRSEPTSDPTRHLEQVLRAEADAAGEDGDEAGATRLAELADTIDDMTPAERTWAQEASEEQLRVFARNLRMGCGESPGDSGERRQEP